LEGVGAGRQALLQVALSTGLYSRSKGLIIYRYLAAQIVHTDMKHATTGAGEDRLQCLWRNLSLLKRFLLFSIAPIRAVPVAVILLLAPLCSRNTPMADFMQRTGIVAPREDNLMIRRFAISGPIERPLLRE